MKWKRLLSLLLAAAMVMCLLPASVLADEPVTEWTEPSSETDAVLPDGESEPDTGTVNPVDPDPAPEPEAENAGGMVSLLAAHTHDITGAPGDAVWEPWDGTSDISKDGNYYLTDDATNSTSLTISGTVNLCLNGHTLTCTGGNQALEVKSGSLTICDCAGGGKVEFTKNSSNMQAIKVSSKYRSFTLYGGTIESSGANTRGVYTSGGDINICGGTVKSSASKGAVAGATGATVRISGGTVDGVVYLNTAKLYLSGTPSIGSVYLYDNPNTATGNQVYAADGGTPYTGGKIVLKTSEANPADGAVVVQDVSEENSGLFELDGYVLTLKDGDLVISSGQSVELTVTVPQGVRYGDTGVFVTAQTVPENATVTYARNQSTSVSCNGFIDKSTGELKDFTGGTFIVDVTASAEGYNTVTQTVEIEIAARPITIRANDQTVAEGGAIQQGVEYVTVEGGLAEGDTLTGITLTQNGNAIVPSAAEFNDNEYYLNNIRYNITYANGAVTEPQPAHSHGTDGSAENPVDWIAWDGETALTEDGNYYLTASVERSETLEISGDVHLCLNGNTLTYTGTSYAIQVLADASLSICDCGKGGAVVGKSAVWTQGDLTLESGVLRSTGTTYCVNIYNGSGESFFTMNGGSVEAAGIGVNMAKGSVMEMNGGSLTYGGNKGIYLYQGEALYVLGGSIAPNDGNTRSDAVGISVGGGYLSIEEDASITGIDYGVRLGSGDSSASATIRGSAAITATGGDAVGQMGQMTLYLMETPTLSGTNSDLYISGQNSTTYAGLDGIPYRGNTLGVYYAGSSYESVPIIQSVVDASKFKLVYPENKYFSLGDDYCLYITDTPPVVGHVHPIAEGMEELTWEPWDGTTNLTTAGNYYLEGNVELTKTIEVKAKVNLCLNGYTITDQEGKNLSYLFKVSSGKLTVCDCQGTGEIRMQRDSSNASAIGVLTSGSFDLYSGKISAAGNSRPVFSNNRPVNIYGGTVEGSGLYGAIRADSANGVVTITGGEIKGAVMLYASSKLYLGGTPSIGSIALKSNSGTYSQKIYAATKDGLAYAGAPITITTAEKDIAANKVIVESVEESAKDLFTMEGQVLAYLTDTKQLVISEAAQIDFDIILPEGKTYGDSGVYVSAETELEGVTFAYSIVRDLMSPSVQGTLNSATGQLTDFTSGRFDIQVTATKAGYSETTKTASFEIAKRGLTVTAKDQIRNDNTIDTGLDQVEVTGLAEGDELTGITLTLENEAIVPSEAKINGDEYVSYTNIRYEVTYVNGGLYKEQAALTITGLPAAVTYGDTFTLSTTGGSGSGAVTWSATGAAEVDAATGKVTLTDTGTFTLTATKAGDWHYAEATATEQGGAAKYELTVPATTFTYNGGTTFQITLPGAFEETVPVSIETDSPNAGTYSNDKYEAVIDAAYQDHYEFMGMNDVVIEPIDVEDPDVVTVVVIVEPPKVVEAVVEVKPEVTVNGVVLVEGTDYAVSRVEVITAPTATQPGELSVQLRFMGNYTGTVVEKVPFDQGTPTMTLAPVGQNLRYTGAPQALVTAGKAENGTVVYSLSKEGPYSETIPTATEAGTYTVWYKVKGDLYFGDTEPASVTATIADNQSTVVTAPKAVQDLVYNSKAQTLVTAGTAENGTMVYSLSETGPYAEELPTAVHAGTYTVWYKVQGNAGYVDTQPAKLTVTIAQAPLTITVKDRYTYVGYKVPTAFDSDDYTVTGLYAGDKLSSIRLWVDTDGSAMVKNGYFVKSGKLPIKAAAVAPDYAITYRFGTLTVYRNAASNNGHYIYVEDTRHGDVEVDPTRAKVGETVTIRVYPDAGYELDELTVTDARGKDVTVSYKSRGVYTFVMPDYTVTVEATFRESGLPFIDVPGSAWYYDSVRYVYEQGLMDGVGNSRFAPNATTTRAMIVTILWRLEGEPQVNYAMQFEDVARNTWYTEAVRWAASEKIVEGYSAKAFGPNDPITREQMAAILYRYAQYCGYSVSAGNAVDLDSFRDGDAASAYAVPALCWAYAEGILEGRGDRMLVPTGTATRAEVAAILMRFNEDVLH